jgi:hypothetical protein
MADSRGSKTAAKCCKSTYIVCFSYFFSTFKTAHPFLGIFEIGIPKYGTKSRDNHVPRVPFSFTCVVQKVRLLDAPVGTKSDKAAAFLSTQNAAVAQRP